MEGTLIVAVLMAIIITVAAFAAEGRGRRLIRILLGVEERRPMREQLYAEVERPEASLDVVQRMSRIDREREPVHS
ncbi:hypothetical protein [Demequina pelophila]|uniref:hypothetical protein n=1 Tax=Demequina pelophila TaxID=1638984 RepID=UPI0012E0717F|nr:hypothetical protein [Demequina pelophila]